MKKITILIASLVLLNSCEHVYKTDVYDPRLPELNDDPKRVAGALIDDGVWLYQPMPGPFFSPPPEYKTKMRIFNHRNQGYFILAINEGFYFPDKGPDTEVNIDLGFKITYPLDTLTDLLQLPREIDLNSNENHGMLAIENTLYFGQNDCTSYEGKLYIQNAEFNDSLGVILKGTFGFLCDDCPYNEILHGRFTAQFTQKDIL